MSNLQEGIIKSDRVEVYDILHLLHTEEHAILLMLETAAGLNLLTRKIPTIVSMIAIESKYRKCLIAAAGSSDISHFMFLRRLDSSKDKPEYTQEIIRTVINKAPQNLPYYLPEYEVEVVNEIYRIRDEYWIRDIIAPGKESSKFRKFVIAAATLEELRSMAASIMSYFEEHGVNVLSLLLRDPRVTPEFLNRCV